MSGEFMNSDFLDALKDLEKEKGISMEVLLEAIEAALISAYKKNFGYCQNVRAEVNRETGEIRIFFRKEVVEEVKNEHGEILLEKARELDPDFELGDILESEVTPRSFGRIAAQTAKQVVMQRIREAERNVVYDNYVSRENDIITGTVVRVENHHVYIDLGKVEALLPPNEQMPHETYIPGERIKVLITEVRKTTKGAQILVSRTHTGLLSRLFEMEVPEIYDGIVEIKAVVREPGARSKIAVFSNNENVDPVGACVGAKGMRVQSIVNELNGEKIEVIKWSENPEEFISSAMSPAKVVEVLIDEPNKFAQVIVPDYQLSLAIGKEGQNARLAARLTGWKIDIKSESQMEAVWEEEQQKDAEAGASQLTDEEAWLAEETEEKVVAEESKAAETKPKAKRKTKAEKEAEAAALAAE